MCFNFMFFLIIFFYGNFTNISFQSEYMSGAFVPYKFKPNKNRRVPQSQMKFSVRLRNKLTCVSYLEQKIAK
jgi:hypothetical protein